MKKALLALALVTSSSSFAADVGPLLKAVQSSKQVISELQGMILSGQVGSGSINPTPAPTPTPGSGGSNPCTFCDEEGTSEEGDVNAALNFLAQAGGSANSAQDNLSKFAQGIQPLNFFFGFGCSFTGDTALQLASADLALGFPGNNNLQWRQKVDSTVTNLRTTRALAGCP